MIEINIAFKNPEFQSSNSHEQKKLDAALKKKPLEYKKIVILHCKLNLIRVSSLLDYYQKCPIDYCTLVLGFRRTMTVTASLTQFFQNEKTLNTK